MEGVPERAAERLPSLPCQQEAQQRVLGTFHPGSPMNPPPLGLRAVRDLSTRLGSGDVHRKGKVCAQLSQQYNQRQAHVKCAINLLFEVLQPKCQECVNRKNKRQKHVPEMPQR